MKRGACAVVASCNQGERLKLVREEWNPIFPKRHSPRKSLSVGSSLNLEGARALTYASARHHLPLNMHF